VEIKNKLVNDFSCRASASTAYATKWGRAIKQIDEMVGRTRLENQPFVPTYPKELASRARFAVDHQGVLEQSS